MTDNTMKNRTDVIVNRYAKNVNGSAWGIPYLAPRNPVDHSKTKVSGAAAISSFLLPDNTGSLSAMMRTLCLSGHTDNR